MNEEVNKELRKIEGIEVISDDLLYQEAVLEKVKENENIDFILLNENLPGEKIEDFIPKINKAKIILFIDKSTRLVKNMIEKEVYNIFTNGEKTVEEIAEIIKEENYVQKLENEIENLRKLINEKENKQNNFSKIVKKIKEKENKINKGKIIAVAGIAKREKAIFSSTLLKEFEKRKMKSTIVDFELLDNSIIDVIENRKIRVINAADIMFGQKDNINIEELRIKIDKIKNENEVTIINASAECFFDYTKAIFEQSEKIFLIIDDNINNIKKSEKLLEIYTKNWKIKEEKIEIIICQTQKEKYLLQNRNYYKSKILRIIPVLNKEREEKIKKIKYRRKDYINIIKKISNEKEDNGTYTTIKQ